MWFCRFAWQKPGGKPFGSGISGGNTECWPITGITGCRAGSWGEDSNAKFAHIDEADSFVIVLGEFASEKKHEELYLGIKKLRVPASFAINQSIGSRLRTPVTQSPVAEFGRSSPAIWRLDSVVKTVKTPCIEHPEKSWAVNVVTSHSCCVFGAADHPATWLRKLWIWRGRGTQECDRDQHLRW